MHDIVVLFEHPKWHTPLFNALERRGVSYSALDLKSALFLGEEELRARLVYNQVSPSGYSRGNPRAVPFAVELLETLEASGARVINGARAFRIECSKFQQIRLMRRLSVPHPPTVLFNDLAALRRESARLRFPAILKPNQGGAGARVVKVESLEEIEALLTRQPEFWLPDNLLLFQEYLPHDTEKRGIIRLEYVGGELLYAMRVVSRGNFNLCPSEICNPPRSASGAAPAFYPFPEVPAEAVAMGKRLMDGGGIDVAGIEYMETDAGRRIFYDINVLSNLRPAVAREFGFDPYDRVVDFLLRELEGSPAPDGIDLA